MSYKDNFQMSRKSRRHPWNVFW